MSRLFRNTRGGDFEVLRDRENITNRSLFVSPLTQAPVISDLAAVPSWEDVTRRGSLGASVSEPMWHALQRGAAISDLIKTSPDEVIKVLRDLGIRKLGEFTVQDVDVLLSFGHSTMMTRGSDTAHDDNFESNWRAIIEAEVHCKKNRAKFYSSSGWQESVRLVAYAVNIKNAAAGSKQGLLSPLVKKSQNGAATDDIWGFPAVRAVIEYKWCHWARKYLLIEFGLYLGWLICFSIFMVTYISENLEDSGFNGDDDDGDDDGGGGATFLTIQAGFFDVLAVLFMLPFVLIELNTMYFYKLGWFRVWNMLDVVAYILQIIITFGNVTRLYMNNHAYNTILAAQCVLLFVKVQYFARVFSPGASFVELLGNVIYKARWFFVFIVLTMISMALAFSALYKRDTEINDDRNADEDFANVLRSLVTVYAILLGDFESDYVFETTNRVVKGIFILGFQIVMSITVLNLLIAVMTESYAAVMDDQRAMFNLGRAEVMDELEIALPSRWGPQLKPYCHFIVVDKRKEEAPELSSEVAKPDPIAQSQKELREDVKQLNSSVEELKSMLETLTKKLD